MFKCNLTGASYRYESMNLLELRTKMIAQFGLKPWDIYAGYSEKSEYDAKLSECVPSALDTPWKITLAGIIKAKIDDAATRKQNDIDAKTAELNVAIAAILEIAAKQTGKILGSYEEYRKEFRSTLRIPTDLFNTEDRLRRELSNIKSGMCGGAYSSKPTDADLSVLDDGVYFVAEKGSYGYRGDVDTAETILHKFDYRKMVSILDYCERANLSQEDRLRAFNVDTTKEYSVMVDTFKGKDYPDYFPNLSSFFDDYRYGYYKRVKHDEIYAFIVAELNAYAERIINVDSDIYYQQVDITPITVNVTADGKWELLDGYKRLLYMNNPELLNVDAPVKVFTDLTDKDFIRLLYSANAWKTLGGGGSRRDAPFHDRGFIFALRQRFGIRFEDYFSDSWKDIDLLRLLQLYDAPSKYCLYNKYLVSDMKTLAQLSKIEMPFFKKENNDIYKKLIITAIQLLGEYRRANIAVEQNELDFNKLIQGVVEPKAFAKKLASKENMSVPGFIDNFIIEHVQPLLVAALKEALEVK